MASVLRNIDGNDVKRLSSTTKHETLWQLHGEWNNRMRLHEDLETPAIGKFFSFGFVRNPWDRMSSLYRYLTEKRPRREIDSVTSFDDFVKQAFDGVPWIRGLHSMRSQVEFFRGEEGGSLCADFIGHYEYLLDDFSTVTRLIGLPPLMLPHHNRSSNSGRDYRADFSAEMVDRAGHIFQDDIDYFGYRFDEKYPQRRKQPIRQE